MALSTNRTLITQTGINTHQVLNVGGLDSAGIATFSNFKTGSTNVHNIGIEAAGINVLGADTPIGTGSTIYDDGGARFSGVVTATTFSGSFTGDGQNLTGLPAGLGTALSSTQTLALNKVYYTDKILSISTTTTVDPPTSASVAYTQYTDIKIEDGHDLIIKDGDELRPDVLGLSTTKTLDTNNFPDGLRGNLIGNVTGDVTGNVTGNVTGAVTPSGDVNVGSNIKLGAASGIVTTTILNTNRITPTGGVPSGSFGGGIIQVRYAQQDTRLQLTSEDDLISASITPTRADSKIMIDMRVRARSAGTNTASWYVGLKRVIGGTTTYPNRYMMHNRTEGFQWGGYYQYYFDTPNTTSEITYTLLAGPWGSNNSTTFEVNRSRGDGERGGAQITLWEISG
tara:strand:+ start:3014 stop:4204 length:1191 start_codon:yes stop_codon:yes gene_type:complete